MNLYIILFPFLIAFITIIILIILESLDMDEENSFDYLSFVKIFMINIIVSFIAFYIYNNMADCSGSDISKMQVDVDLP